MLLVFPSQAKLSFSTSQAYTQKNFSFISFPCVGALGSSQLILFFLEPPLLLCVGAFGLFFQLPLPYPEPSPLLCILAFGHVTLPLSSLFLTFSLSQTPTPRSLLQHPRQHPHVLIKGALQPVPIRWELHVGSQVIQAIRAEGG